jgi:glycosyltransferase involved in cell wall biosynthesis
MRCAHDTIGGVTDMTPVSSAGSASYDTNAPIRRKLLTIITPVFNEEANVRRCYEEVKRVAESLGDRYDYEHIFGNNRSVDATLSLLREIARDDPRVRVLSYSRNFGAEKSALTLMRHASGDAMVGITCDLQEPPALIPKMVELWEQGNQVVYGVYRNPNEALLMRSVRSVYYALVDRLSPDPLPRDFTGFALLDRRALDEVIRVDDHSPYIRGVIATIGFKQIAMPFERAPRVAGESKHGLSFLFDFGINGIVSHSVVPIRVATYVGAVLAGGAFTVATLYGFLLFTRLIGALAWQVEAPASAAVLVVSLFFSGVQLMFLGVIGEYIGAIHAQVRRKPFLIVEERINFPKRRARRRPIPEPALQPEDATDRIARDGLDT